MLETIVEIVPVTLEQQVILAQGGERAALEWVIHSVQKDIYQLAIRFLWHPQDAEDATQEILIRVITGLKGFRGESGFRTWVYRIASNALLTLRKQRIEQQALNFESFAEDLAEGLSDTRLRVEDRAGDNLLLEEVKVGCTLAMLQCLDREHRMAYILGEIMELEHLAASTVLEISAAAFRQRLSRARTTIFSFMQSYCGLINPDTDCRCHRRVDTAVARGCVNGSQLLFATSLQQAKHFPQVLIEIRKLEETRRVAALYQSHLQPTASDEFVVWLRQQLDSARPVDSKK